jgi:DNA-binding Lrp family transcriptional regulator
MPRASRSSASAYPILPDQDPYELVLSLNIHRRHLTAEQKRELVEKLVKQTPDKSDRQIAKETKTSPTTVGKIRKEAENAGDVSKLDTRTDTKGRKQPSAKPKKSPKTASPAKNDPIGSSPVRYFEAAATSVPRSPPADDLVDQAISLIDRMSAAEQRGFIAQLKSRFPLLMAAAKSADVPVDERKAEHAALAGAEAKTKH